MRRSFTVFLILALLLALVPAVLAGWPRWLRRATWALAGIGLAAVFAY